MKKILFTGSSIICFSYAIAQIPAVGLTGYWPMDGDANDYSGYANHGTVYNAALICDRCGNSNKAYSFNGTDASIVVNNSATVDMTNSVDFSVAFWMKTYSSPNNSALPISKNQWGSWSGYQFFTNNVTDPGYCTAPGQLSFYAASGAWQDACADQPVCTGSNGSGVEENCTVGWYFICGVYDASTAKSYLYVNGVQQSDVGGISGSLSNLENLVFGAHPNNVWFFKGALDGVRIYKAKLTQTDINALYAEPCLTGVGINEQEQSGQSIRVFPNPAADQLNIVFNKSGEAMIEAEIKVLDVVGKEIISMEKINCTVDKPFEINTSGLANGSYFISVKTTTGTNVLKFQKVN